MKAHIISKRKRSAKLRCAHFSWLNLSLLLALPGISLCEGSPVDVARGPEILKKFVEINRYWLVGPPSTVRDFSYVLQRSGGTQRFEIPDAQKAPRARLQGVTYSAMLHQLARNPKSAKIRAIDEENNRVRVDLELEPPVRGACGNGVENSWNGYHSLGGNEGFVVLDSRLWVPLEAGVGRLRETFGEFVTLDQEHYFPLAIRVNIGGDTEYNWRFRVYEPGLWLFDDSHSAGRRLAWVEEVKVNSAEAKLAFATTGSLARTESEKAGTAKLEAFLNANRHWLLPSLEARRRLAYEYRQEPPYLERVLFGPEGHVFVRLESSKESPGQPTRHRLWLPDGRSCSGNASDAFASLEPAPGENATAPSGFRHDRMSQHLAMGLALDCALTRLAREPGTFWAETRPVPGQPEKYLLVLHTRRDARLFTGTMLTFTSWAYMHDVSYDRSEVICEAATHRPLEEKDFSGSTLKGRYSFEDWLKGSSGAAPGRIRAEVPHEKDGKDQSLEMDAGFRWVNDVWLLEKVVSRFRGSEDGSTGTVTVLKSASEVFQPIRDLLQKAEITERMLTAIANSSDEGSEAMLTTDQWANVAVKAAWTEKARESVRAERGEKQPAPLIGIDGVRLVRGSDGFTVVELKGVSTASWKEFETKWQITSRDPGAAQWTAITNYTVRAESAPAPFVATIALPSSAPPPERILIQGTVQRLSGAYHGHGIWFRLAKDE